jgi:predicted nucleotide-binding protein (sugar kinase/HSP70/actin superfamily)
MATIGIPRALLYHRYHLFWETFFAALGERVLVSPPTNKGILELGIRHCLTDICLPVKLACGHVLAVASKVDFLFLPRVLSVEKDAYTCPKIVAFPDMVRLNLPGLPPILDPVVDLRRKTVSHEKQFREVAERLGRVSALKQAAREALRAQKNWFSSGPQAASEAGFLFKDVGSPSWKGLRIAVLGHPYNLFDSFINFNLLERLTSLGIEISTIKDLEPSAVEEEASRLEYPPYWTAAKELLAGARIFLRSESVDGVIYLIAFECGPDALIKVLIDSEARKHAEVAYMSLVLDEHSGEAGMNTRVEAFLDAMVRRKRHAGPGAARVSSAAGALQSAGAGAVGIHQGLGRGFRDEGMIVTYPHMGPLTVAMKSVFRRLGQEIVVPPPTSHRTIALGARYSPELVCLPFKVTLGNMIEGLELGADTVAMATSHGNCRLGFYWPVQEIILRDMGFSFRMVPVNYDKPLEFLGEFRQFGGRTGWREVLPAFLFGMRKLLALEELEVLSMETRPREKSGGLTTRLFRKWHGALDDARDAESIKRTTRAMRVSFCDARARGKEPLARIRIVGEAYMMAEPNVNFHLQQKLGDMGVEVERSYWLGKSILRAIRLDRKGRREQEQATREASPYMRYPDLCTGCHSIGETIQAVRRDFDGVVLIMPFTCMPEVLAQSVMHRVSEDFGIPVLPMSIDEHSDEGGISTRLEAFIDLIVRKKRARSLTHLTGKVSAYA